MPENALATTEPIMALVLPSREDVLELKEVLAENLEGMTFNFIKIKIPSGGGLAFEVPNEAGDPDVAKEIRGVLVDHYPINGYWSKEYDGEKNPPACSSLDTVTGYASVDAVYPEGSDKEGQPLEWIGGCRDCGSCPLNQFGSDPRGGKGKACKNMRRLYLLQEGALLPLQITAPPTSLGETRKYMQQLSQRIKRFYGVVTGVSLAKATSGGGIDYSKLVLKKAADLSKEETVRMKEYANAIKPLTRNVKIDDSDYAVEPDSGSAEAAAADDGQPY